MAKKITLGFLNFIVLFLSFNLLAENLCFIRGQENVEGNLSSDTTPMLEKYFTTKGLIPKFMLPDISYSPYDWERLKPDLEKIFNDIKMGKSLEKSFVQIQTDSILDNFGKILTSNLDWAKCSGIILPGGSDVDPGFYNKSVEGFTEVHNNIMEDIAYIFAIRWATKANVPLIGFGRGFQVINVYFGGTLNQFPALFPSIATFSWIKKNSLIETVKPHGLINFSHNYYLAKKGKKGMITANYQRGTNTIPAFFEYPEKKIYAIQGHSEGLIPPYGIKILNLFSKIIRKAKIKSRSGSH